MQKSARLPSHIVPERYKIKLKPDLNEFTFTGEETIHLILEKPAKQIILHSAELEIESAEFIHKNNEIWAGKIAYDKKAETATFTFPKNIRKGEGQLRLIFKGILNDKMRGFYRSKYEHEGKEKYLATTQFEATDARRAFPCFDEPHQKAIFDVSLIIPKGHKAISNTIESVVSEHESGYQIIEFAPTPKMSVYLLAFIVGDFEYIEGKSKKEKVIRVFTTAGKKEQGRFALEVAIKCLDFYGDYFGIEYPLPVLDMIAIPDFAAGAMENWGAVTYRESILLIDEEKSSVGNKQWMALVIAHELAHMWFGDLVTMKWWTHLWLNEGFASYIEYLAIDHIFPQWDVWIQFVSTELSEAFALDALKNTHPIEVEVKDPAEISEIFDKVSYSKGASVIRMLANYLGEEDFQKGLQFYLKKHSYSNAQTEDLWESLEEVSGKPVAKVMKNWTAKGGHPVINVKIKDQKSKIELTQNRFFSSTISKKQSKDKTIWNIPIKTQSSNLKTQNYLLNRKMMEIPNLEKNGWIKFNVGEVSLVRFAYPEGYLKGMEVDKLSAPDRLGLIRDSFDLAQSGQSLTSAALDFAQSYKAERDYTVWSELTAQLSKLDSLLAYETFYKNFQNYGRKIYGGIAQELSWEKEKGEKHTDVLLRGMVLYRFGAFGDKDTIKKAQDLFKKDKIDPDLRGVVYNLVAENGGQEEYKSLFQMYRQETNQQEKDRIGRALGLFQDEIILRKTLEFSLSKFVRYQNVLQIIASVWSNPKGRYLAWEFVKKNWKLLKERYAGGHYFTRIFQAAGEFTRGEDAKNIEEFVKKHPVPEAKRTIAQALEQIYSNAEWLKRDRKGIEKFLEKLD